MSKKEYRYKIDIVYTEKEFIASYWIEANSEEEAIESIDTYIEEIVIENHRNITLADNYGYMIFCISNDIHCGC
jgi:hypothetical protein